MCHAQLAGTEKGWLLIVGGGETPDDVKQRFVVLAGGHDAHVVFIPTAMDDGELQKGGFVRGRGKGVMRHWGINPDHVTMLHTRDKGRANAEYFSQALQNASGVVIWGGRQWRLADAYLDTAVERGIKDLLARGGVVFGSSAGATIQGSYLVRGDPKNNKIMMSRGHERGFGLLTNTAIDQHVNTKERKHDLINVVKKHPELLGIGIDEGAWIEVHNNSFTVHDGQVTVYDVVQYPDTAYFFLSPEDKFELKCVHAPGAC